MAAVAAGFEATGVFDLEPSGYRGSVETFTAGPRDIEVDVRSAGARIPYILPGPADAWAGSTRHALHFRLPSWPARPVTLHLDAAETHDVEPPVLSVSLGDRTVRDVRTRRGTGLPPPHGDRGTRSRYEVRIPPPPAVLPGPAVLSVTNVAGSWIMWERVRLVEAPAFALAHLGRAGGLPAPSAALLAVSLALVVLARRPTSRFIPTAATAALFVLLLAWSEVRPAGLPAPVPRYLWLTLAGLLVGATGSAARRIAGALAWLVLDPRREARPDEAERRAPGSAGLLAALPLWLVVTFLLQGDLVWRFGSAIWGAEGDGAFSLWNLAWTSHALVTAPLRLFDANIFYPARDTLALSDHRFSDQLVFAPAYALSGSPIVAVNVLMTAQFVLTALATSLLAHRLFGSWRGALLAGAMVAFSPTRIPSHLVHAHLLSLFWTPLALLCFDRLLASRAWRDAWLFTVCLLGQMLASFFLGYALLIALVIWTLAWALLDRRPRLPATALLKAAAGMAVAAPAVWLFGRPYLRVREQYGALQPSSEFFRLTSADGLASYFAVHPANLLYGGILSPALSGFAWEKWLFPGFLCLGLGLLALAVSFRRDHPGRRPVWMAWTLVAVFGLLSLGPEIRVGSWAIPSPYVLLWHVLPGFTSMRVPARFGMLSAFGLALAAAGGFRWLETRLAATRRAFRGAVFAVLLAGVVLESAFHPGQPGSLPTPAQVPEEYRWLAAHGVGALLELPSGESGEHDSDIPAQQVSYMYFSVYHWRPLVNGYSGHVPTTIAEMAERVKALPSPEALAYLQAIGVRQLLVHPGALVYPRVDAAVAAMPDAAVTSFPTGSRLVTLPDAPRGGALSVRLLVPARARSGGARAFGVLFRNDGGVYWVNPEQRACRLTVSWNGPGGRLDTQAARVLPPVALAPGEMQDRPVGLRVPEASGRVTLASLVSCARSARERQEWRADVPVLLAGRGPGGEGAEPQANLEVLGGYAAAESCAGCPVPVRVHLRNVGEAAWTGSGPIRLAARWRADDGTGLARALGAARDVDAGDEAVISLTLPAPATPGSYELWVGAVREGTPAAALPSAGFRAAVTVRP